MDTGGKVEIQISLYLPGTCYVFRMTGFLDFVHRTEFSITRKPNVSVTGSVSDFMWLEGENVSVGSLRQSWAQSLGLPPLTQRQKQIQFPKRCNFQLFRILENGQIAQTQGFWVLHTIVRTFRFYLLFMFPHILEPHFTHIYIYIYIYTMWAETGLTDKIRPIVIYCACYIIFVV
jgi:hypothetical protein